MIFLERARQYFRGSQILLDWLGSGGETVSQELADHRASVCIKCALNYPGPALVTSIAHAIKDQIELKKHLELTVKGEHALQTCAACNCVLPLKVWLPIDRIRPDETERERLDKDCWLLSETK